MESLRRKIIDELRRDPSIDASKVNVAVDDGRVILWGSVHTYPEKLRCDEIIKAIRGVTNVQNDLEVRLTIADYRSDETLQRLINDVLEWIALLPQERPSATVINGCVTIQGCVLFAFQKRVAGDAVGLIAGVRAIVNRIEVVPHIADPRDLEKELRQALCRRLPSERSIDIKTRGGRVTLRGTVATCAEREQILDLVCCAPGVAKIDDHLQVKP